LSPKLSLISRAVSPRGLAATATRIAVARLTDWTRGLDEFALTTTAVGHCQKAVVSSLSASY